MRKILLKEFFFVNLVAVVIAFIICYAPFHVQRLITSSSNAYHLSLIKRRAIAIFYFISGIFYYLGSTINPIFYHLFSRKYREACLHTMKRIVHCRRHYRDNYSFHKTVRTPPVTRLVVYANLPRLSSKKNQPIEPVYRSSKRYITSLNMNCNKQHVLKVSLPAFKTEQVRL
jgi:hypothetical protein